MEHLGSSNGYTGGWGGDFLARAAEVCWDVLEIFIETKRIRIPHAEKDSNMKPATDRSLHADGMLALRACGDGLGRRIRIRT